MAKVPGMPVRLPARRAAPAWPGPPISSGDSAKTTTVEEYWSVHTVNSTQFRTPGDSARSLDRRPRQYPLFRDFMDIPGSHRGEVVLDYGCGPGDDLVEFLLRSDVERVIGADTSRTALGLSAARLALHQEAAGRVELLHVA